MTTRKSALQCWKCGSELKHFEYPYSRYEECTSCKSDLHVCLLCRHYDPAVANACCEDRADSILDKDKANFCDYFKPRPQAHNQQINKASQDARTKLAELFGEDIPDLQNSPSANSADNADSEADRALAELKRLFGDE